MRAVAVLALALLSQHATRYEQLAEAHRLRDLALYDRAEEVLRGFLNKSAGDPQAQKIVPEFRAALCEVLLAARKYDELKTEGEVLRRHPKSKFLAITLLAAGAWHSGKVAEAKDLCDEADKAAAEPAAVASTDSLRRLRMIRGLLGWKRFETPTHIVHYPPDSPIDVNLKGFGYKVDAAFERVKADLGVEFPGKIEAFIFNDQAQADAIVERTLGLGHPASRSYFTRADAPPGFAIAQVLSFFVANRRERRPPKLPGLCEGFYAAHAADARWDRRREELPRQLAKDDAIPPLSEILGLPGRDAASFALSGAFVRWLIKTRGRELFRRLWAEFNELAGTEGPESRLPWAEVYGDSPEVLEAAWRSSIK
jgi:hypothetical protein